MHDSLLSAIRDGGQLGHWTPEVTAFLGRAAALDFIEEFLGETGSSAEEGILTMLAAIRFIDRKCGLDAELPTVLEAPPGSVNLDLFLVRHHAEIYHLCRRRPLQTNLPERALPVLELMGERFPNRELALIELGSSFGLLGRVACAAGRDGWDYIGLFEPGQQMPRVFPRVTVYRGIDRSPPDAAWAMACIPHASVRLRTERFIKELPVGQECTVNRGSALDLPQHPAVMELIPRFNLRHPEPLIPVVLTSFLLSRLKPSKRLLLARLARQFAAANGGAWINQDFETDDAAEALHDQTPALPRPCKVWLDGEPRLVLDSEYCRSWRMV